MEPSKIEENVSAPEVHTIKPSLPTKDIIFKISTSIVFVSVGLSAFFLHQHFSKTITLNDTTYVEETPPQSTEAPTDYVPDTAGDVSYEEHMHEHEEGAMYTDETVSPDTSDDPIRDSLGVVLPQDTKYVSRYNSLTYKQTDGQYVYLENLDLPTFEYINEDYVKDKNFVYLYGVLQQFVNPENCTKENLQGCARDENWKREVAPYTLDIAWHRVPQDASALFPKSSSVNFCRNTGYQVGTVQNGMLAGSSVYAQSEDICEMWCSSALPTLPVYHYVLYRNYVIPVGEGTDFSIPALATLSLADKILIPNSSLSLLRDGIIGVHKESRVGTETPLFTSPMVGPVYRDAYNCFVSENPDHTDVSYSLELPFAYQHGYEYGQLPYTKLNGSVNEETYNAYQDYSACMIVVPKTTLTDAELTKVGEFPGGVNLYTYADANAKAFVDLYNNPNTLASYDGGKNQYTYSEFLSFAPYLFWKDPFGDWVQFKNRRFESAAEKCKPVIYLYPEAKGVFDVTVKPNGGFTQTIPPYDNGWNVIATPESMITDTKTGTTYPYLYWEGVNTGIPEITEGWIVERELVSTFLDSKLALLGMNAKEIADFKEYWVERLHDQGGERYKIMFLPKEIFDQLSPLSVTGDETPQNVIRIMMYAQEAKEGETLPEQILPPTPSRTGFTVVEWGGALLNI